MNQDRNQGQVKQGAKQSEPERDYRAQGELSTCGIGKHKHKGERTVLEVALNANAQWYTTAQDS